VAIIINEFEIVPEAPQASAPAQSSAPAPAAKGPRPEDVEQIMSRKRARGRRVHAD